MSSFLFIPLILHRNRQGEFEFSVVCAKICMAPFERDKIGKILTLCMFMEYFPILHAYIIVTFQFIILIFNLYGKPMERVLKLLHVLLKGITQIYENI